MTVFNMPYGTSMSKKTYLPILFFLILLLPFKVKSQHLEKIKIYDKKFQISLFPGISTNGIETWRFHNKYSLNIFGGLSAGNKYLEIGTFSNINLYGSSGIQIAGLANIVGANAFANLTNRERKTAIKEGFEANTTSIQFSGLLNYTRKHATGFQFTGGLNVVGGDFVGLQVALIANEVSRETKGMQLGGLYNISSKSTSGIQASILFNSTHFNLTGIQIGLFNNAKTVTGKKLPFSNANSIQIGLINKSKKMAGTQIGLINFGGKTVGTQIGLINFFSNVPNKEQTTNGLPIGLINIGTSGPMLRAYSNELFSYNLEITTGNCSNCTFTESKMPLGDKNKKFNQNALIIGVNHFNDIWGFGYGFQKLLLNKKTMSKSSKNERRMMSYGIQFLHLNKDNELDSEFNLLSKVHFELGRKIKKAFNLLPFGGLSFNLFLTHNEDYEKTYVPSYVKGKSVDIFNLQGAFWVGYTVGIQL